MFGSLKRLRIRVDRSDGHKRACEWIMSCAVLYNLIKPIESLDDSDFEKDDEVYDGINCNLGEERRADVFQWINDLE